MSLNEKEIEARKEVALKAIKAAFGSEEDEYGATLFIEHHLEEIEKEYWIKNFGTATPEPNQILDKLILKSHWNDDCIFDFTLPNDATDYVISVQFDENGEVEDISMES